MLQQTPNRDDDSFSEQSPLSIGFWSLAIIHAVLVIGFLITRGLPMMQNLLARDAQPAWSSPADYIGEGWPQTVASSSSSGSKSPTAQPPKIKAAGPTLYITRLSKIATTGSLTLSQISGNGLVNPAFDAYDQNLKKLLLSHWMPPVAEAGTIAHIRLSISLGGVVQTAELTKASGDLAFDTSVRSALTKLDTISMPLPNGLIGLEYVVEATMSVE